MKLAACLLAVAGCSLAVDIEFDGFHHFKNWDGGHLWDYHPYNLPGTTCSISKDLCAVDPNCTAIAYTYDKGFKHSGDHGDYDVFLGIKDQSGAAPAAQCVVESGGANVPTQKFLHCPFDGFITNNTYALPPDLIHSECMSRTECVGFRIKNDQASGDIYYANSYGPGFFKI